jgi:hypothetical protein
MTPIKKQVARSGEIAGTVATNVMAAQAILERVYAFADAHGWGLTDFEKSLALGAMCMVTQVLWYNCRKFLQKYMGGVGA